MEKDTGYASAGLGSNHPEIKRRDKEIDEICIAMTLGEKMTAIRTLAIIKWHEQNSANTSFKAGNEKINVIVKKD